jgi:hypothetical protein
VWVVQDIVELGSSVPQDLSSANIGEDGTSLEPVEEHIGFEISRCGVEEY